MTRHDWITAWRITRREFRSSAFSGKGAAANGGRWNNEGSAVVYTSESMALATLEMLVHAGRRARLTEFVLVSCAFPPDYVTLFDAGTLPHGWPADQNLTRGFGQDWIKDARKPVLRVPTAIVPAGFNYLVNVDHPLFKRIHIGHPVPFLFDPRLM